MKPLKESILDGGAEAAFDNVEILEKAKKWLDRNAASVKGLKINEDGTLDAEQIKFWLKLDLYTLPDYIKFNYVRSYMIADCTRWHGLNGYPKKIETLYIERGYGIKDLANFDVDAEVVMLIDCHRIGRDLKIPKNSNIKKLRMIRCSDDWRVCEQWEKQCKQRHIIFMDY